MPRVSRNRPDALKVLPVFKPLAILWLVLLGISELIIFWHQRWGISLLWGSSVCLLPAMIFAWYAAHIRGARDIHASVQRFYAAEAAKFILTAILFAVVFTRGTVISLPVFFCAFIATQILTLVLTAKVVHQSS